MSSDQIKKTPLFDLHGALGAKMAPFAGYLMPIHYPAGIKSEHLHTRSAAGLFDVSHMGQAFLIGLDGFDPAAALEGLVPGAIAKLKPGAMRYSLLLDDAGGILDDLMITRSPFPDGRLFLVVNAGPREEDFAHIARALAGKARLARCDDRALLALQGPKAAEVLRTLFPESSALGFMQALWAEKDGVDVIISRSGYTGEDGFEISLPASAADAFVRRLLSHPDVMPIGLGARDSLRLEAGLCLYGHDIDKTTSPAEANLGWAVPKSRRERADFPGASRILEDFRSGPARLRVGILPDGRAPAREGAEIFSPDGATPIGRITSGGFGPSLDAPLAIGYVRADFAATGSAVALSIRGKLHPARIAEMPFVPHRYIRKG